MQISSKIPFCPIRNGRSLTSRHEVFIVFNPFTLSHHVYQYINSYYIVNVQEICRHVARTKELVIKYKFFKLKCKFLPTYLWISNENLPAPYLVLLGVKGFDD